MIFIKLALMRLSGHFWLARRMEYAAKRCGFIAGRELTHFIYQGHDLGTIAFQLLGTDPGDAA